MEPLKNGMVNFKIDCIMKQLFKVLFFATAITVLFSCDKVVENETPIVPDSQVRTVQFSAGEVTKSVFGTPAGNSIPTLWTDNQTVAISLNLASHKQSTTPVVANEGATATFSADIEDSGSSPYTFYAVSPYCSVISVSSDYNSVQVDIPASQTPLATSVDESAQILVAKYDAGASFPTTPVTMSFDHVTAYGKISFSNLSLAQGESIVSVSLTASQNWVGRYYYYLEDHTPYSAGDIVANSAGKTITLTTSSSSNIWFACAPVDLGGETVKVVITTDQSTTYSKTVTIPAGKTFASGKVNAFTINMNGISADSAAIYDLVTDPSELTAGTHVIIAAPGAVAEAMSTTQNGNNRGITSVTKDGNTITSPSDAVQIFTIAEGTEANTVAFYTGAGYIYAASSSSNYLRTEVNLTANSSWNVTIDGSGIATVVAQGSNTRNHMRYNGSNNPHVISAYASTSTVETKVSIYKEHDNTVWDLRSIAVTTAPDKTTYEEGEDFDPTGMVVTATYEDHADNSRTKNTVIDNNDLTISPSTSLIAGTTSVSITYNGKSTSQAITVTAPITWDLRSIAVTTAPTKITYTEGEYFDPTGLVVTATFENHDNTLQTKNEVVDNANLTFTPSTSTALTTGNTSISISYTVNAITKSTTQAITVNSAGSHYYVLVTDVTTLNADDVVLLINTDHDALPAFTGTSTISPTDLSTKYDSSNDRFPTNDATVDNCAVTLVAPTTAIDGKVVFKLKMSNDYYIVKTGTTGTGFNPNKTSDAVSGDWTLTMDDKGRVQFKHNLASATRGIVWRSGTTNKFGAYAISNVNNTEYYNIYIYKLN